MFVAIIGFARSDNAKKVMDIFHSYGKPSHSTSCDISFEFSDKDNVMTVVKGSNAMTMTIRERNQINIMNIIQPPKGEKN